MAKTKMIPRPKEVALARRSPTVIERVPVPVMKMVRAARAVRRSPISDGLAHVAVGVAGGVAGAGATALLIHAGATPFVSGLGVTLAGGTGAVLMDGKMRTFSASVAATGFSSAMFSLLAAKKPAVVAPPRALPPPRQAALSDDEIYAALRNAEGWEEYRNADGWDEFGRNADGWDDYRNAYGWEEPYRNGYDDDYRNATPYAAEAAE